MVWVLVAMIHANAPCCPLTLPPLIVTMGSPVDRRSTNSDHSPCHSWGSVSAIHFGSLSSDDSHVELAVVMGAIEDGSVVTIRCSCISIILMGMSLLCCHSVGASVRECPRSLPEVEDVSRNTLVPVGVEWYMYLDSSSYQVFQDTL
jgi:hypothetical protein